MILHLGRKVPRLIYIFPSALGLSRLLLKSSSFNTKGLHHHFSQYALMSISCVNDVRGCVCKCQYASAIWHIVSSSPHYSPDGRHPTASGLILASGASNFHSFACGVSIGPSITACETCTPCGPNSRARLCAIARVAHLPDAKVAKFAEPRTDAVAPVKTSVGGCAPGDAASGTAARSRGRAAWEKRKAPCLWSGG